MNDKNVLKNNRVNEVSENDELKELVQALAIYQELLDAVPQ